MNKFFQPIKRYSQTLYRILLFAAVTMYISNLLPRERQFKYEYGKGEPWRYADIIAPFDFRICKTDNELQEDKDSILKNFRPYFMYDKAVVNRVKKSFRTDYISNLSDYGKKYSFLRTEIKNNRGNTISALVDSILDNTYNKGIISIPETFENKGNELELMLIKDNLAEPFINSEFFALRSAYQYITIELAKGMAHITTDFAQVENFISGLQLNKHLLPNILIDDMRTSIERDAELTNLSLTNGIILTGQRFIEKGEIIDDNALKILDSYKIEYEKHIGTLSQYNQIRAGQILITILLLLLLFLFLYYYRNSIYRNLWHVTFLMLILCTIVTMGYISTRFTYIPVWVIPIAILPLIVRTFMDSRLAFFFHIIAVVLTAFFSNNSFDYILLQIPVGMVSILSLYKMDRRSQIVRSSLYIFISYSLFYTGLHLMQEGDITSIDYLYFIYFFINCILIFTVYPLIYIFEKMFGFLSDVTLVELSDTNHPLLRKLAEITPGTFQHSIQVGNLAQEVAYKIGANPLLVRAGAMYHDIGKTEMPIYFTENQNAVVNPHNELEFTESAKIIIAHIENGIKIARKHKLPERIVDFIATHHGTTKTKYFYNSYVNKYPDKDPNIKDFTYPGPTPHTKETAILMMADSIEAASRSMKEYSDETISNLVEGIINGQIEEQQFANAPITFAEITIAKQVFKQKLKNIYHARIAYPTINKDGVSK